MASTTKRARRTKERGKDNPDPAEMPAENPSTSDGEPDQVEDADDDQATAEQPDDAASVEAQRQELYSDPFAWLQTFSASEWERMMVYCYRLDPYWIIDKTGGKAHYTAKWGQPFDADEVLKQEGSGGYEFQVVMQPPRGGPFKRIRQFIVNMMQRRYPPNLPYGDWLKHPKNKHWQWCAPILLAREHEQAAAVEASGKGQADATTAANQAAAQQQQPAAAVSKELVGLIAEGNRRMMELTDPTRQIETMDRLMKIAAPAKDDSTKELIGMMRDEMRILREQNARFQDKLLDLQTQPRQVAAASGDPMTSFLDSAPKFFELAKLMGFERSGGAGGNTDDKWMDLLDRVLETAQPIVDNYFSNRDQQQQQQPQPQQPAANTNQGNVRPIREEQQQRQQPQTVDVSPAQEQQPTMKTQEEQDAVLEAMEPLIRITIPEMIKAIRANDAKGLQRWFLDEFGRNNLLAMRDELGSERLSKLATTHALLKTQLPDQVTVKVFLDQFFDYKDPRAARTA